MRGFSLIETLTAMAIGAAILVGLMEIAATGLNAANRLHRRADAANHADAAQLALARKARGLEPDFWEAFPRSAAFIHGGGMARGGAQLHASCEDNRADACVVFWDLRPVPGPAVVYRVEDTAQYPDSLAIAPIDTRWPLGPAKDIAPMSVLLVTGERARFCALVHRRAGARVELAAPAHQPWRLPDGLAPGRLEAVHLGRLEVTHCGLTPSAGGAKLSFQPWTLGHDGWRSKRRQTAQTGLRALVWTPPADSAPGRLTVSAQPRRPRALSEPVRLGGRLFWKEAVYATLEL